MADGTKLYGSDENAPAVVKAANLETGVVAHGFFLRTGGVSEGIYASLNCGRGSGDARQRVEENRSRVAPKARSTFRRLATATFISTCPDTLRVSSGFAGSSTLTTLACARMKTNRFFSVTGAPVTTGSPITDAKFPQSWSDDVDNWAGNPRFLQVFAEQGASVSSLPRRRLRRQLDFKR